MQAALRLYDETPGAARRPAGTLRLVSARTTLRELLRRRIEEDVENRYAEKAGRFPALVEPSNRERLLNGGRDRIDLKEQLRVACQGFSRNWFIVLLDDRQITDLDEPLPVRRDSTLTFIRLFPLAGG